MKTCLFALLVFVQIIHSQIASPDMLGERIPEWQKEFNVPAVAVGVIEDGQMSYSNVFGEGRIGVQADDRTIFTVASLTKPVFALIALKLVDNGTLDLDEPLYRYHIDPEVKDDARVKNLNARFVLSHQSGFLNWRNMGPSGKLEFNFEPGSQYLYSGEGYEYLRKAIEVKTGESLPELAERFLFKPLHLRDISFTWNASWDMGLVAYPHNNEFEEYDYAPRTELNAAAGLQTTIGNYTELCAQLLKGRVLSSSLFDKMTTPQVQIKKGLFQGLGWEVIPSLSNGEMALIHSGDENGVKTFVVLLPRSKKGLVVFTNADDGFKLYRKITESYLEEGREIFQTRDTKMVPIELFALPEAQIGAYTGTFQIKENVTFDIVENNGKLNLIIPGQSPYLLIGQSERMFQVDQELKVEFADKGNGGFTSVLLYQHGIKSYEGKRIH